MAKPKSKQVDEYVRPSRAEGRTNKAMLEKINVIRDRLATVEKNDTVARYEVAVDIHDIRNAGKYGTGAMQKLAEVVGRSESWLNDYARVAEIWPEAEKFAALAAKKNKHGIPLTWSHYIVLTREPDDERREGLMERALTEGWKVDELEAECKKHEAPSGQGDEVERAEDDDTAGADSAEPSNMVKAVVDGIKTEFSATQAKLQDKLPKIIQDAPDDQLDEALASLQEAREQFAGMHASTLESFDLAIAQLELRCKLAAKKKGKPAGKTKGKSGGTVVKKGSKKASA